MTENNGDDPKAPQEGQGDTDSTENQTTPEPGELAARQAKKDKEFDEEAEDMSWVDELARQVNMPLDDETQAQVEDLRAERALRQLAENPGEQIELSPEADARMREMARQMEEQYRASQTGTDPATGQPYPQGVKPMQTQPESRTDTIPPKESPEPPAPLPGPGHPDRPTGSQGSGNSGGGNPTGGDGPISI